MRLDPNLELGALSASLAGAAERTRNAVVRLAETVSGTEHGELRSAVARVLGIDPGSFRLRVRRPSLERASAIELTVPLDGSELLLELAEGSAVVHSAFRGSRLAVQHAGQLPAGTGDRLHHMGNRLARVDRAGASDPDVSRLLDELRRGVTPRAASEVSTPERLFGPEANAIRIFLQAYRRWSGRAPRVVRRSADGCEVLSLDFPEENLRPESSFVLPARILSDPVSVAYLQGLGFDWTDRGELRCVPLPSSYRRALAHHQIVESGFTPRVVEARSKTRFERERLNDRTHALLSIRLASRWYYALRRPLMRAAWRRERWEAHFSTLLRDMGKLLLPCQLLPTPLLGAIGQELRGALADARVRPHQEPPAELLAFYDTDLHKHGTALWSSVSGVDELPAAFVSPGALGALIERLQFRIRRARGR